MIYLWFWTQNTFLKLGIYVTRTSDRETVLGPKAHWNADIAVKICLKQQNKNV